MLDTPSAAGAAVAYRNLSKHAVVLVTLLNVAEWLEELEETGLGRVAVGLAVQHRHVLIAFGENGVVAERADEAQTLEGGVGSVELTRALQLPDGSHGAVVVEVRDSHAVLRQRSGLVAGDHRRRPERLNRLKVLDHDILLRHSFGGERQFLSMIEQDKFRQTSSGRRHTDAMNCNIEKNI